MSNLITIRQDKDGRYNLNDLHKAAGGERRYDTREFFRRDSTLRLATELEGKMTQKPVNFQAWPLRRHLRVQGTGLRVRHVDQP